MSDSVSSVPSGQVPTPATAAAAPAETEKENKPTAGNNLQTAQSGEGGSESSGSIGSAGAGPVQGTPADSQGKKLYVMA